MKLSQLVGERFRERPSDCQIDSHALLVRGGYIRQVANGIYSFLPPMKRITRRIEEIIREEMEAIGGQEVQFPVVLPASLWQESGRYEAVGKELLRFQDRNQSPMVLGMTHEEAAVHLAREYGSSYTKYPFLIYQIQTKFRDEARPRGGLIRVREFTMKDAYSFHTSQEDLERCYWACYQAYERIFQRVGLPEVVSVSSDSGMMGGNLSHEFMLLTPAGEDSVVLCPSCGYRSNMEAAESLVHNRKDPVSQPLSLVSTPDTHTIQELCQFLQVPPEKTCKGVVYQKESDGSLVVLFLRGDLEVNEAKLRHITGANLLPAQLENSPLTPGFLGPYQLPQGCQVYYDRSLSGANNLVCGGNLNGYHYTGLQPERDLGTLVYVDAAKAQEQGVCPHCGRPGLRVQRGIELGNIFQLGTKYSESMGMSYQDASGAPQFPLMGCYGIGVGRLAASICEACHDAYGPIWPVSVAPWQLHLCAVRADQAQVREWSDRLYQQFQARGIEPLYDDRRVSAGNMFADADLLGAPLRVVVSPRNLAEGCCELSARDKSFSQKVPLEDCVRQAEERLKTMMASLKE
jgi:prolyl-tRNA synthetase